MSGKKKRKRMRGTVAKVIPSLHDGEEKAEIDIHGADPLCSSSEPVRPAWPMGQATLSISVHP